MVSEVQWTSLVAQMVKRLPTMWQTQVQSLGWEDPLEKEMATHSSTLAKKISWSEEHGRLQFMGLQRVRHNSATSLQMLPELVSACSWVWTGSKGSWGWCFLTDFWSWDLESLSLGHGYFRASVCSLVGEAWIFACRTLMIWEFILTHWWAGKVSSIPCVCAHPLVGETGFLGMWLCYVRFPEVDVNNLMG